MFEPHAERMGSRDVGRYAAAIVGVALVIAALTLAASARAAAPQFTPLTASVLAPPEPVEATDGRLHVVYEILVHNTTGLRVDVQSLAVRAEGARTLLSSSGLTSQR